MHRNQGGGWTGEVLACAVLSLHLAHVSPPGSCPAPGSGPGLGSGPFSCPGSGSLLCRCHQGRAGVPGTAIAGLGQSGHGPPTCGGLRPGTSGHTLRIPAGCVKPLLRLGFRRKRRVLPLVQQPPRNPLRCLALARKRSLLILPIFAAVAC